MTAVVETVDDFLERLRRAWDDGDADAYGALFAEDATYVIFMGDVLRGREEIVRTHRDVFVRWQRGTRMRVEAVDVRPPSRSGPGTDGTTIVLTVGGIGRGSLVRYDKLQTFVLRPRDARLECVAFQNTEMSRRSRRTWNTSGGATPSRA